MPDPRLLALMAALLVSCTLFMFWGLTGRVGFILELQTVKLLVALPLPMARWAPIATCCCCRPLL